MFEDHGQDDEVDVTHEDQQLQANSNLKGGAGGGGNQDFTPGGGNGEGAYDPSQNAEGAAAEYGDQQDEAGQDDEDDEGQESQIPAQVVDNTFGMSEEEELKQKIVLYYHTLVSLVA